MTDLKAIADLLGDWQPPKPRELHCHPDVSNWLMLISREPEPGFQFTGSIGSLTGIPVFEEPDFEDGNWELREEGHVISNGHVDVPYLARKLKIEFKYTSLAWKPDNLNWRLPGLASPPVAFTGIAGPLT